MDKRVVKQEIFDASSLRVEIIHNGFKGGDSGNGGFVDISIFNIGGTCMMVNGEECESFNLRMQGDSERRTLVKALKTIVKELETFKYK